MTDETPTTEALRTLVRQYHALGIVRGLNHRKGAHAGCGERLCRQATAALATPEPTPDVEAAWEALIADLDALAADPRSRRYTTEYHRPIIEAAIRAVTEDQLADHLPQASTNPDDTSWLGCSCGWARDDSKLDWVEHILARLRETP
jgi:DNA-binding GntR family transcriptional regulator